MRVYTLRKRTLYFGVKSKEYTVPPRGWLSGSGGGRPGTEATTRTPSAPPFSPKPKTQVSRARFRYAPDGHIGSRIGQEMSLHCSKVQI